MVRQAGWPPTHIVIRVPSGGGDALRVLAGQQSVREGKVGKERQAQPIARRQDVDFRLAVQQAVLVLNADESSRAGLHGSFGGSQLLRGEVRAADFADLAGLHEIIEGAERVGNRHARVGRVELIEIDPIGAEALEAALPRHAGRSRAARRPDGWRRSRHAELRRDDRLDSVGPPSALPRNCSLFVPPYMSAVSKKLMPASSAA